jgi:hypothetical protein
VLWGFAGLGVFGLHGPGALAASPVGYADKMKEFDASHDSDVWLDETGARLLPRVVRRMARIQRSVGFGNFGVLSFDAMIKTARAHSSIGRFPREELAFLEQVFFSEASEYGFLGRKVVEQLTDNPRRRKMRPVRGTGHRLFEGEASGYYLRMRRDVGHELVLTSGVRSVVKQFHLFLRKAERAGGNLSLASRSLAPPGYSFHGVGDFDVGMRGLGAGNFTAAFARTPVFRRLVDLGYAQLRYPADNLVGVRYEPWHMRVVS